MNAYARYSGLRAKRCLPAEFHRRLPTTDLPRAHINFAALREPPDSAFRYPQVAATINFASNSANSRFFTDCYPIHAAFAPKLNQITTVPRALRVTISNHIVHN